MLFYAKTSTDYFFRQTLTAPELWPHLIKIQETLLVNNKNGKIRSSTGIRESVRLLTLNSVANSIDNRSKNKSIDRNMFENMKETTKHQILNKNTKTGSSFKTSRSTEGVLNKKSLNLVNNYVEQDGNVVNFSQKDIKNKEDDVEETDGKFFERIDNLAEKKLKIQKRKHDRVISIIEEEDKHVEQNNSIQTESEVLKGRMHVEFIYKEDRVESLGNYNGKKIEIINN